MEHRLDYLVRSLPMQIAATERKLARLHNRAAAIGLREYSGEHMIPIRGYRGTVALFEAPQAPQFKPVPKPKAAHERWRKDLDDMLRRLAETGKSASQIAEIMGLKSRNAVIGRAHRLGIQLGRRG
jgi:hypothetical protein